MRNRRVEITPMQADDLEDVLAIEQAGHPSPWPRQVFAEELERAWARIDVVRERADDGRSRVVAFCNYWIVRDEVHLLNIATHPDRRRRGHGAALMDHMLAFARQRGCKYLTLEVRRSNSGAIALYERYGFEAVGVRRQYYVENSEDAIVMALELP
jgi:ribosomal-protein-alanine N-acetyltransferase